MRHLVLSDIHGNWPALEAVLQAAPPFDRVLFLGDAVGYYPDGDRVLGWLREVGAECVLGHHDAWLLALDRLPVEGEVLGARRVQVCSGGRLFGDVQTQRLVIDEGARFEGACRMPAVADATAGVAAMPSVPAPEAR